MSQDEALSQENVWTGDEVDLYALPIVHHHEKDPGPYVSAGMLTTCDIATHSFNTAIQRGFVAGPREIRVFLAPRSHNEFNRSQWEERGEDMPIVYWVGHHPSVIMGSHTQLDYPEDHYKVAGGVAGEPLRLVPSQTIGNDFLVPADAEFVIEGYIAPGDVATEAPFGEYPRYYGPQRMSPRMRVTAVTFRNDAMWDSFMVATNNAYGGTQEEGNIYEVVKRAVPQVQRVHVPVSGSGRFHAYVQLKKTHEGQPKEIIMAALSSSYMIKHVVVVDDDIDVFRDDEVLWAIATRSRWDRDVLIVPGAYGSILDPSADPPTGYGCKGGIDATRLLTGFAERCDFPQEIKMSLHLENYLSQLVIDSVPVHLPDAGTTRVPTTR